jgi:small-conductance mechanosensitive channel
MKGRAARTGFLVSGLVLATVLLTGCPKTPVLVPDASSGATSSTGYVKTTGLGDVHFAVDRAAILPADQRVLDANAAWLKSNAQARLLLKGFADSGIDLELYVWVADPEAGTGNLRSDIYRSMWKGFNANNIAIPFPQREVRILRSRPS